MPTVEPSAVCPHCGQPYRPSAWGRNYACPACGRPLKTDSTRSRTTALRPLVYSLAALFAFGGAARLAADRLARATPRAGLPRPDLRGYPLPPDFEQSLRQRLRLCDEDLQRNPQLGGALRRAADSALSLALLSRESAPARAEAWRRRAEEYALRYRRIGTADADLEARVRSLGRLEWGPPLVIGSRRSSGPSAMSVQSASTLGAPNGPMSSGGVGYPGMVRPQPDLLIRPSVAADPTPNGPTPVLPGPPSAFGPPPPVVSYEESVAVARDAARRSPRDPTALWALADLLEQRVQLPSRRRPLAGNEPKDPLVQEVLGLYLRAARLTQVRSNRGTYYHDASRLFGRLRDDARQYQCLHRALEATPYASTYWADLRDVSLRLGKIAESRRAAANYRRWLLPSAQLPPSVQYPSGAAFSSRGPRF